LDSPFSICSSALVIKIWNLKFWHWFKQGFTTVSFSCDWIRVPGFAFISTCRLLAYFSAKLSELWVLYYPCEAHTVSFLDSVICAILEFDWRNCVSWIFLLILFSFSVVCNFCHLAFGFLTHILFLVLSIKRQK